MRFSFYFTFYFLSFALLAQSSQPLQPPQFPQFHGLDLSKLKGKKIGLVTNHTAVFADKHLLDILIDEGLELVGIFSPEHGLDGLADAGELIKDNMYKGIPIISLYGKKHKPAQQDMRGIEVMIFCVQDVGVRCYTYISTMHYIMEACAEENIPLKLIDRPNPNGFYIDGMVLDTAYSSFVGIYPIPLVYGMTIGELALMANGEGWVKKVDLEVIPYEAYDRKQTYILPIRPSPNLPTPKSIYLYPSLVFFEGTPISAGRGTDKAFEQIGAPVYKGKYTHSFVPQSNAGAKYPKFKGKRCYGKDLSNVHYTAHFSLSELIEMYRAYPNKATFFNDFFDLLAGTDELRKQIQQGKTEKEIRQSWQKKLEAFRKRRLHYLLYEDF